MKKTWWSSRWAVLLAMVASTIPLWFVQLPPLIDLLAHMGRYHVQLNLADNPVLQRHWAFEWRLLGNLGFDLMMEGFGRVLGVEAGARVLAALLVPLAIGGMVRLARAAHGEVPATAWAALPFALAYPWQYGLVNYWLGFALALHAAAWLRSRDVHWPVLGAVGVALWSVHIYGWAILCVLVWSHVAASVTWRTIPRATLALWPLGLPILLMIALDYGQAGIPKENFGWFLMALKLQAFFHILRDQHQWLDLSSLALAIGLIFGGLKSRAFAVDPGLCGAALLFLAAVLLLPFQLFGSAYADARLWPVVLIVALLAIRPVEASGRIAGGIALAAAAVLGVRLAATTAGFVAYDRAYARHLAALDRVPRGSRIASFVEFKCQTPWRRDRLERLDGIAIVRRDAFTNGQWDVPGAQLLTPLGAAGTKFNADPSNLVRSGRCPRDLRGVLAQRIAALPRDRFEFVWIFGFSPAALPVWPGLEPVFADEATILYRIER